MISEERIKELIKIWAKKITTVGWCWCIEELIRSVAAEQDLEIERLQFQVKGLCVERTTAKQCAEKAEADNRRLQERVRELVEMIEPAYREGWYDVLDFVVADTASSYPNKAQQDNGWLESDANEVLQQSEAQHKEGGK